jgi:hypothetical protein
MKRSDRTSITSIALSLRKSQGGVVPYLTWSRKRSSKLAGRHEATARLSGEIGTVDADRRAKDAVIARLSRELEAVTRTATRWTRTRPEA